MEGDNQISLHVMNAKRIACLFDSLTEIPSVESSKMCQHLKEVMEEADIGDLIHDVILEFGNERVAAHKYILSYRCEYFRKIFTSKDHEESIDENQVVKVENVQTELFHQLLTYIYTDTCDMINVGKSVNFGTEPAPLSEVDRNIGINDDLKFDGKKTSAYAVHSKTKGKGKKGGNGKE